MVRSQHSTMNNKQTNPTGTPWMYTHPKNKMEMQVESICDMDRYPNIPNDHRSYRIAEHEKAGKRKVVKVIGGNLFVGTQKAYSGLINGQIAIPLEGYRIDPFIRKTPVTKANANFADFIMCNPDFFPDNHKIGGHCLVTWGTVFRDLTCERKCLRAIRWNHEQDRPEYVVKTLFDKFCNKCFFIYFR